MTMPEIQKALNQHRSASDSGRSAAAIKKALQNLKARPEPLLESIEVSHPGPGPRPVGYRLARSKVITWPAAAAVVLALYNYPDHEPPDRRRFVNHVAALKLPNENTGAAMEPPEIDEVISACLDLDYMSDDQSGHLVASCRADAEIHYLKAIAKPDPDTKPGGARSGM
ncbi:MAG TPA: hypothetical protein VGR73_16565 [Bryobacteraceae bacterium]|nr:hypothetical protein [Bryobacteraceae bacterium]